MISKAWQKLARRQLPRHVRDTYFALAYHCFGDKLRCRPGQRRLARMIKAAPSTVNAHIGELAAWKVITRYHRGRKCEYDLHDPTTWQLPPHFPRRRQNPKVSADCSLLQTEGEATFGSSATNLNTKEEEAKTQGNATEIARSARHADPEADAPPASTSGTRRKTDTVSLRKFRRDCWLTQKLPQYAKAHGEPDEFGRLYAIMLAEGPLAPADQEFLDDLDRRMRRDERAGRFKAVVTARFRRRGRIAASTTRTPEDRQTIREMLVGKHYRCLLARRGVEAAAAYSEQVAPLLNGQGDVEAAKALFEQVDRWMRHVIGWDDMRHWKATHRGELGKVHRYGRAA